MQAFLSPIRATCPAHFHDVVLKNTENFALHEAKLEFLFRSVCSKHVSVKVKGATGHMKRTSTLIFFLKEPYVITEANYHALNCDKEGGPV